MKVALIRPPEVNPHWYTTRPSLGISYISSYLKSHGVQTDIFDANYNAWTEDQTVDLVAKYRPDIIGITAMTHEINKAHSIITALTKRLHNIPSVIGGCHITALPQETLTEFPNFSYGIYGEGEQTMLSLIECLRDKRETPVSAINGLVYRNNTQILVNPPRTRLSSEELSNLPYPNFGQYFKNKSALSGKNDCYVMISSRGCPYNCIFCMQVLGRQVRRRSAESIVEEMEYAIEQYGAHTIYFLDEIFLFNDQLTYDILELIKKHNLPKRIRWRGLTRVNFVDEKLIRNVKEAGCFVLEIGIEAGSNEVLKRINKQITVEQAEQAVKTIKDAGISVEANFILGHPNETVESIKTTINLAAKLNPDAVAIGVMTPYPGTKIFDMAQRGEGGYRLLTRDWSKYDKYGGRALELEGLSIRELEKWQRLGLLYFYLKNFRMLDLLKFVLKYRKTIINLLKKKR
jgi:anaerobic magnesium-protoporphyrin IX monomethyl ester cyclase